MQTGKIDFQSIRPVQKYSVKFETVKKILNSNMCLEVSLEIIYKESNEQSNSMLSIERWREIEKDAKQIKNLDQTLNIAHLYGDFLNWKIYRRFF